MEGSAEHLDETRQDVPGHRSFAILSSSVLTWRRLLGNLKVVSLNGVGFGCHLGAN